MAIVAANINILRRGAPFAYLFSNESWNPEDLGDDIDYINSLSTQKLRRGIWLGYPSFEKEVSTEVTAIFERDVLPFVSLLGADEFSLLCLPTKISLKQIDMMTENAESNEAAIVSLLAEGGFVVTVIDHVNFSIWTLDKQYSRYFSN